MMSGKFNAAVARNINGDEKSANNNGGRGYDCRYRVHRKSYDFGDKSI